jgi:hypothetical protein
MKTLTTKREREPRRQTKQRVRDGGGSEGPLHMFHDVGPPIETKEYRSPTFGDPEVTLKAAFEKLGRDYGGQIREADRGRSGEMRKSP